MDSLMHPCVKTETRTGVNVNFSSSKQQEFDALCLLLPLVVLFSNHNCSPGLCRPDVIEFDNLKRSNAHYNLQNAFNVAEKELGLTKLLDPEGE